MMERLRDGEDKCLDSDLIVSAPTVSKKNQFGGDTTLELIEKPSDITVDVDRLTCPSHEVLKKKNDKNKSKLLGQVVRIIETTQQQMAEHFAIFPKGQQANSGSFFLYLSFLIWEPDET